MKRLKFSYFFCTLLLIIGLAGCGQGTGAAGRPAPVPSSSPDSSQDLSEDGLLVHFIDVGQGDSILIQQDGHAMLVDAGENDQGETVVSYLKEQGITQLDYVIGTHPHSDQLLKHIPLPDCIRKLF